MKKVSVLITGASGGIGEEFARRFAEDGYDLILAARNEEKLQFLKNELESKYSNNVLIFPFDLSVQENVEKLYQELSVKKINVDILVNNAGFGLFGEFTGTDLNRELNMIDLNVKTLTHMTKLFLGGMIQRNQGKILNIASTAAFQPGPLMAVYYATKAYVLSFTEALENELKGTGVTVSALCPGATETGFSKAANLEESKLFASSVMDVKTVVDIGYTQLFKKKTVIIPGFKNKLLAASVRFMPRKMVTSVVRKVQERLDS